MRNVAFSMLLAALALLQVAVVATELTHSDAQSAAVAKARSDAKQVLASNDVEMGRKTSSL